VGLMKLEKYDMFYLFKTYLKAIHGFLSEKIEFLNFEAI